MRANRLISALDLIQVVTKVTILVLAVVAEVSPFKLTHVQLRGIPHRSFSGVLLRHEALEAVTGKDESDFVGGREPSWITASRESIGYCDCDFRLDQDQISRSVETVGAKRLLINTKSQTTIRPHELVRVQVIGAPLVFALNIGSQIFLDIKFVAKHFDRVDRTDPFEVSTAFALKGFGEQFLAQGGHEPPQHFKADGGVRVVLCELYVDVLRVTRDVLIERMGVANHEFHAGAGKKGVANVGVDDA